MTINGTHSFGEGAGKAAIWRLNGSGAEHWFLGPVGGQ